MTLQTWIIEPRDSLIVRDGKPFGASVTHATSLDFPFPSTTTGGVRTRAGLDSMTGIFTANPNDVKKTEVRGSLLAEIDDDGEIIEFYLHSPADALFLQDTEQKKKNEAQLCRLQPLDIEKLSKASNKKNLSNLPKEILFPVGLDRTDKKDKPYSDLKFWNWRELKRWLEKSYDSDSITIENYGIKNLQKDARVHVAVNEYFASVESALFQTRGLEFNYGEKDLTKARKFGLVVFVDNAASQELENKGNLAPLGGERRLVNWRKSGKTHSIFECPADIKQRIKDEGHCRLMLLTPAFFSTGLPQSNADYEVKAIACNRYQTVSGWDFDINRPKPTRRLVPAGSILFLKINGDVDKWIENTWFNFVGDDVQAKKDGFGLSVLGTWDGKPLTDWR